MFKIDFDKLLAERNIPPLKSREEMTDILFEEKYVSVVTGALNLPKRTVSSLLSISPKNFRLIF